ncbi:MAG: hypothetical protein KDD44_09135 [Bdellovibrionales bacterium]|nr:hypothetical protein [Bdellovibrionales bacterium]
MDIIPTQKIALSFVVLVLCAFTMKWFVDSCVPAVRDADLVFARDSGVPRGVCRSVRAWDLWGREKVAIVAAQQSMLQITPEGKSAQHSAVVTLGKELLYLPLVLSRIPGDAGYLVRLIFALLFSAFIIGILLQWLQVLLQNPAAPPPTNSGTRRRPSMAEHTILPSYFDNKSDPER